MGILNTLAKSECRKILENLENGTNNFQKFSENIDASRERLELGLSELEKQGLIKMM